jgi:hypothetical protein
MAEHNYHQAGLQHLAHLQQDLAPRQAVSVLRHQHLEDNHSEAIAQAALEAYLQRQCRQQEALVEIQALEHQRLAQHHQQS